MLYNNIINIKKGFVFYEKNSIYDFVFSLCFLDIFVKKIVQVFFVSFAVFILYLSLGLSKYFNGATLDFYFTLSLTICLVLYFTLRAIDVFNMFKYGREKKATVKSFYPTSSKRGGRGIRYTYYMIYSVENQKDKLFKDILHLKPQSDKGEIDLFFKFREEQMTKEDIDKYAVKDFSVLCKGKRHVMKDGHLNSLYDKITEKNKKTFK